MNKSIIVIVGLLIFILFPLASAIILESGTIIEPTDSNTKYTLGNTLSFSSIIIENDTLYFNGDIFWIEADSGTANVTINSLTEFEVTATDNVDFAIGGFTANTVYDVEVDVETGGAVWDAITSNAGGVLSFVYTSWSTHNFSIILHTSVIDNGDNGDSRPGYSYLQVNIIGKDASISIYKQGSNIVMDGEYVASGADYRFNLFPDTYDVKAVSGSDILYEVVTLEHRETETLTFDFTEKGWFGIPGFEAFYVFFAICIIIGFSTFNKRRMKEGKKALIEKVKTK